MTPTHRTLTQVLIEAPANECESCIGTGIGWHGVESYCRNCGGTGIERSNHWQDEDRWAFNHYTDEPNDLFADDWELAK